MKDKILYLIVGVLIGAIATTGVFMVINKNTPNSNNGGSFNRGNGSNMRGTPPTQEEIDAGVRTEMEDGSVRIDLPNGGVFMQKTAPDGGGPGATFSE